MSFGSYIVMISLPAFVGGFERLKPAGFAAIAAQPAGSYSPLPEGEGRFSLRPLGEGLGRCPEPVEGRCPERRTELVETLPKGRGELVISTSAARRNLEDFFSLC